jgi:hypothetical protein
VQRLDGRPPQVLRYGKTPRPLERTDVNYILVMRNERDELVAVGPVSIEYQAAMIRDELEESAGWTAVGIARVLTEEQARTIAGAPAA